MTPFRALLLVLAVVGLAAAIGVLVESSTSSGGTSAGAHERLLAKARPAPKIPSYEPGSGWPSLPPPPEPVVASPEPEPSAEEGYVSTYAPEPTYSPPATGSGGGGRPHGITGGGCSC